MDSRRLRFKEHVWYLLEVSALVWFLYDIATCQFTLSVGGARGLSGFWSGAGRVATVAILGYLAWTTMAWIRRRPLQNKAHMLRLLIVTQVVAWMMVVFSSGEYHILRVRFAIGVGVGCFAVLRLARPFVTDWFSPRALRLADLITFTASISLVGLELGLRLLSSMDATPLLSRVDDGAIERITRFSAAPGLIRFGFPFNKTSDYDDEFEAKQPDRRRVVSIGDGFSVGVVPHYHHFSTVAERAMDNVEVCNVGVPGVGPFEYLHLWRTRGRELDPDVVVVNVFVGNDIVEASQRNTRREGRGYSFFESWYSRSNALIYLVPARILRKAEANRRGTGSAEAREFVTSGWEHGQLIEQTPTALENAFPWTMDPSGERPAMSVATFMEIERTRARETTASDMTATEEVFLESMERIRLDLKGVDWVVMIIPDEFQVNDRIWNQVAVELPGGEVEIDRSRPQKILRAWLEQQGIPYVDLLPVFRAVPPMKDGLRHLYHKNDTHFNTRGNRTAGEALATFLTKKYPFLTRGG